MRVPQPAGNPAAGLLVLLVGLYLLLAYFAGRLEWLFSLNQQVGDAKAASSSTSTSSTSDDSIERQTSNGQGGGGGGGSPRRVL